MGIHYLKPPFATPVGVTLIRSQFPLNFASIVPLLDHHQRYHYVVSTVRDSRVPWVHLFPTSHRVTFPVYCGSYPYGSV